MMTKAVRLYGVDDLRLEEFELPPIKDDEVLARVISDSLCMSSYKTVKQGAGHRRVPNDVADNPIMLGHEFCGEIVEVGSKWKDKYKPGMRFAIQPAHFYEGSILAPGYSYNYCGGDATYCIIPMETLAMDCLLPYEGDGFFYGSLSEPMSCIIGTYHAMYHTTAGSYTHRNEIVPGGKLALLASVGPMGLGAIDYALHSEVKPSLLVVTDINAERLARAEQLFNPEHASELGVELHFVDTSKFDDPVTELMRISGGTGFDDVIVFAPVRQVVEQGCAILGVDGCLNFFAGPTDTGFEATMNFYNVHYASHHVVGTSGGNTDDMKEALDMMAKGLLNPAVMVTHIGGLNCVVEATKHLPEIPGGKKLVYTQISLPLTAIEDFAEMGRTDPLFAELDRIVKANNGMWNPEAEAYLLEHAPAIS